MKKTLLAAAALALVLFFSAVPQTPKTPKHHVVFQLTEAEGSAWNVLPQACKQHADSGVAELVRIQETGWSYIH